MRCVLLLLQDYEPPSGKLQRAIEEEFGSLDKLTTKIDDAAKGIQVSSADYNHRLCCKAHVWGCKGNVGTSCHWVASFLPETQCRHCQHCRHALIN